MSAPAEVNPRAGTERSLPLPSAPSPLGRLRFHEDVNAVIDRGYYYVIKVMLGALGFSLAVGL